MAKTAAEKCSFKTYLFSLGGFPMSLRRAAALLFVCLFLVLDVSQAFAISEAEKTFLQMYFKDEELVVISATRSLKSVTRVAENVEVVTKEDIELMNAHTVADVLNTVNGVIVSPRTSSPGGPSVLSIQGSGLEHVAVFMDGIRVNFLETDVPDIGSFPVQMIEKIEVIKGPASSAWGSSLGGVVNIITKSPGTRPGSGMASVSYGERGTADMRAELTGTTSGIGYYLSAGHLRTAGLRPEEDGRVTDIYLKVSHDISKKTSIGLSLFYDKVRREEGELSDLDLFRNSKMEYLLANLSVRSQLTDELALSVNARASRQRSDLYVGILSSGEAFEPGRSDDRKYGVSATLTWRRAIHNVVVGTDYDYRKAVTNNLEGVHPSQNVVAIYANDTISLGRFAVTPGIRYDHTDRVSDFTSPSLGVTYEVADKTILRGYVARGFNLPPISSTIGDATFFRHNPALGPEKVWSYQAGIESGLLQYAWVKVSAFRHDIRDAIVIADVDPSEGTWTAINADKVRRQGIEVQIRSMKFDNFTVSAGAMFMDSKNPTTGADIRQWPSYTYDVSLKYDDEKSFRALLKGRYVWWHVDSGAKAKYDSMIFDINLIKAVLKKQERSCEVFLTGHNIFGGSLYEDSLFKNAPRWFEAGLRYNF